jgi:hypothetical protein
VRLSLIATDIPGLQVAAAGRLSFYLSTVLKEHKIFAERIFVNCPRWNSAWTCEQVDSWPCSQDVRGPQHGVRRLFRVAGVLSSPDYDRSMLYAGRSGRGSTPLAGQSCGMKMLA